MIPVQDIINIAQSALDDDGNSQRYTFSRDWQPAINYAQNWLVNAFSSIIGDKKFPEENLSDLIYNRIFVTNRFSRIVIDGTDIGDLWGVLRIPINPVIYPNTPIPQPDLNKSVYASDRSFVKAYKSAKRLNAQEIDENRLNPFSAGNEVTTCDELKAYGYKLYTNYKGGYDPTQTIDGDNDVAEIEIVPEWANKVVAIEYIKQPKPVVLITDDVEFPTVLTDFLVQKTLDYMAYKRDEQPLAQATAKEIQTLTQLMS